MTASWAVAWSRAVVVVAVGPGAGVSNGDRDLDGCQINGSPNPARPVMITTTMRTIEMAAIHGRARPGFTGSMGR